MKKDGRLGKAVSWGCFSLCMFVLAIYWYGIWLCR